MGFFQTLSVSLSVQTTDVIDTLYTAMLWAFYTVVVRRRLL